MRGGDPFNRCTRKECGEVRREGQREREGEGAADLFLRFKFIEEFALSVSHRFDLRSDVVALLTD
jgi:hypothetical protein